MQKIKTLCIIPAAGKGTRLGLDMPKIMAPLNKEYTIWDVLYSKLKNVSDIICVVMSPWGVSTFLNYNQKKYYSSVEVVIQSEPIGMGDAVFCAAPYFHNAQNVIVIWGDQVNVSIPTLTEIKEVHGGREKTVVLPTVATPYPYVEYIFTDGRLTDILESREGALCKPNGFNDVGTFILSVNGLNKAWEQYTKIAATGTRTGELNFLPFILYLSKIGWDVIQIIIEDVQESRGVNTHEDLLFAADKFTITSN